MKKKMRFISILSVLISTPFLYSVTDINKILYKRYINSFSLKVSGKISGSTGNIVKENLKEDLSLIYTVFDQNNPSLIKRSFFLIGKEKRDKNAGVLSDESRMVHLRAQEKIRKDLYASVFAQINVNPFTRLKSRGLLGLGSTLKVYEDSKSRFFVNAMFMSEQEEIDDDPVKSDVYRASLAAYFDWNYSENLILDHSLYVQPDISNYDSDYRIFSKLSLEIKINESSSVITYYKVEYDSLPPEGVEKTDQKIESKYVFSL